MWVEVIVVSLLYFFYASLLKTSAKLGPSIGLRGNQTAKHVKFNDVKHAVVVMYSSAIL